MDPKVQKLLERDYPVVIGVEKLKDGTEKYAAWLLDFPGCIAQGGTSEQARERLEAIKPAFFEKLVKLGVRIPRQTSLPGVIPGAIGFYDPRSGLNVIPSRREMPEPKAKGVPGSNLKVRLVKTA